MVKDNSESGDTKPLSAVKLLKKIVKIIMFSTVNMLILDYIYQFQLYKRLIDNLLKSMSCSFPRKYVKSEELANSTLTDMSN